MTHRITVKTLKQETVTVEVPPACTVDDCKEFLRAQRPDLRIGFYLHIPFPPAELFSQLPWRRQLNGHAPPYIGRTGNSLQCI